ncbi:gem (nuclear organelle) associated protein 2 [Chytriomyces hyalinus]|nr:gem (nuclear organelle) associated protein 2 [Chytriomyces hyalinus]
MQHKAISHAHDASGLRRRCIPLDDFVSIDRDTHAQATAMPASGLEYLRRVRAEAELEPVVSYVGHDRMDLDQHNQLKRRKIAATGIVNALLVPTPSTTQPKLPPHLRHSAHCTNSLMDDFKHARLMKGDARATCNFFIPKAKDDPEVWFTFCYPKHVLDIASGPSSINTSFQMGANLPLMPILKFINHSTAIRVLALHKHWIEPSCPNIRLKLHWILMLLICLDVPLFPDQSSLLRDIVRKCQSMRNKWISQEYPQQLRLVARDERLMAVHAIVAVVSKFFGQADLSDPMSTEPCCSVNDNVVDAVGMLEPEEEGEVAEIVPKSGVPSNGLMEAMDCDQLADELWDSHLIGDERYF